MAGLPLPFADLVEKPDPKVMWMEQLHECENVDNIPRILDTNGYYSYEDFMYQMSTWLKYGKTFGTTRENIHDHELQWRVTRYILDHGGEDNWYTCSRVVEKKLGKWSDLNS